MVLTRLKGTEMDTKVTENKVVVKGTPTILFSDESLIATCLLQKGTTFASVDSVTDPRMNKTGNPFIGRVLKHQTFQVCFGDDYEAGVQRKADKAGLDVIFEAQPLKWGSHYQNSKFVIEHKGQFYLQCRVLKSNTVEYRWATSGTPLTDAEVVELKRFIPDKAEGTRQPAEDKVIYRTVKIENITEIRMWGVRFVRASIKR
jgi:hypothetical protein